MVLRWSATPWSDRRMVIALAAVTLFKGLFWIALMPIFKIADEPSHFENVQYRAEYRRAPRYNPNLPQGDKVMHPGASPEVHEAWETTNELWRGRIRPDVSSVPQEDELRELAKTPRGRRCDGQTTSVNYPGLYYDLGVVPYLAFRHSSVLARIEAVRLLALAFAVVAVVMTFLAARLMMRSRALALAAALVVCLQPMESQMAVAVNNDAGVIGFSAIVLYLLIRFVVQLPAVPSWKWGLAIGVTAAADVCCKPHAFALMPACGLVCMLVVAFNLRDRRAWLFVAAAAASFAVVVAPTLVQSLRHDVALAVGGGAAAQHHGPASFFAFLHALDGNYGFYLYRSSFAQFGWLEYYFPDALLAPLPLVAMVSACGLVVAITVRLGLGERWLSMRGLALAAFIAASTILFVLYAEYRLRTIGLAGIIQGRSFLFGLPAVALLVAAGWGALVPSRLRTFAAMLLAASALSFQLLAIAFIARYHYAP